MKDSNVKYLKSIRFASVALAALALSACTMEPDYERPETPLDSKAEAMKEFKHADGLWKDASPEALQKGKWWLMFEDEELDVLIASCREKNSNLRAAFYAVESSRQKARMTQSDLFPHAGANASWSKSQTSRNEFSSRGIFEDYRIGVGLTWDLDLFGRVQALMKSDVALAQAQYSAYESVMLMLESEVASTYFTIRQYNTEIKILNDAIATRKVQLSSVQDEYRISSKDALDLGRAEQLYYEAASQLASVTKYRDAMANYLAYIVGSVPSAQTVTEKLLNSDVPATPQIIPSELLERRPDIAEWERKVYAANFRIGSATSAFFPTIQITSSLDMASADIGNLLESNSLAWGVSPRLYLPIFQAGKLWAQREVALAEHAGIVEQYKDKVMFAIYEVENALANIKNLKDEYDARSKVSDASINVTKLTKDKFDAGVVNTFELSDAQRLSLANERETIRLRGDRFRAVIELIRTIGGSPLSTQERAEHFENAQTETE